MGSHYWLFPWIAIVCGVLSLLTAIIAGRKLFATPPASIISRGFLFVWLIALVLGTAAALKLSTITGAQWIEARGFVLGSIAGLIVAQLSRRSTEQNYWLAPAITGLVTATVATGQLWLNPGEINGLMSIAIGMAMSVLCLSIAPATLAPPEIDPCEYGSGRSIAAVILAVTLVASVQLGFSKAHVSGDMYWSDIPLLMTGALSLLLVVACAIARGLFEKPVAPTALAAVGTLAVSAVISWQASHEWRILIMSAVGATVFLVGLGLIRPALPSSTARLGSYVATLLVVLSVTVCFAFWSGYGMALLALGMWTVAALPVFGGRRFVSPAALIALGFASTILICRMAILQSGSAVRATGPGDLWDVFSICLGALLPVIVAEWARFEAGDARFPRPIVLVEWLAAVIGPAIALEFIWQPRSLAGLYLGLALGMLFANRATADGAVRDPLGGADRVTVSALLISLVMFAFLPMLSHIDPPTRMVRVSLILILAALLLIRLFLPGKAAASPVASSGVEA